MSNKSKKPKKKKKSDSATKKKSSKADSKPKKSKKQSKTVNLLEPPKLTKEQEEKILKDLALVTPQVLDTHNSINIATLKTAIDIIDSQLALQYEKCKRTL